MSSEKKPILSDDKGEELAIDIPQDDPSPSVPKSKKSPKAKVEVVVDIEHTSSPEPPSKDNKEEEIGHSPSPESKIHKRSPRIAADDEEKGLPPTQEPKAHKKILPKATEKKGIKQPPKQKIHHKRSSPESIVEEIENDPSTSNLKIHEKVSPKAKEISHPPISQPNVRKENSPKPSKKDDGNKSDEYLPPEAITDNKGKVVKVINPLIPEQESHKESSRKASKENDDSKAEEAKGNSDDEDDLKMDVLQKDDLKLKFKRHSSSQDSSGGDSVSYEYTIEEDFNVTEDYAEKQSGISSQSFRLPQYTKDNAQLLISCCRRNGRACKVFCFSFNAYYQSLFIFLVIILYLLMGAYVFEKLEEKTEMQRMVDAGKNTTNAMTEILNLLTNQTNLSKGDAENLRTQIIEQSYIIGNATEILYPDAKWDFSYALFFSTTVITTIGMCDTVP